MYWWVNLGIVCILIQYTDGQCQPDENGFPRFGPNCGYLCHCQNGDTCDEVTGECANRCANGWMGPGCQYRDMALTKATNHVNNIKRPKYASDANDGNPNTCSVTKWTLQPWWRVHFGYNEVIRGIVITPQGDRLVHFKDGFQITVENNPTFGNRTKPADAKTCYKHTSGMELSPTFEIYCTEPLIGNQVRIQLTHPERRQLTLCDVHIFGGRNVAIEKTASASSSTNPASLAIDGRTATENASQCSTTSSVEHPYWQVDLGRVYVVDTAILFYNAVEKIETYILWGNQYLGLDNRSWINLYDDKDSDTSPTQMLVSQTLQLVRLTRHVNPAVLSICELQVFGDCPEFACGLDCSLVCHCNRFSYQQKVSGVCTSGCEGRWTGIGQQCDRECGDHEWGPSCQNTCGQCHGNSPCEVTTGHCGQCAPGFQLPTCTEPCQADHYGVDCNETCSKNCQAVNSGPRVCNIENGHCMAGCLPGWDGDLCDTECDAGHYGIGCNGTCSSHCLADNSNTRLCDIENGHCLAGCDPGWEGDLCASECEVGYYGIGCSETCSTNCNADNSSIRLCHNVNGHCLAGCISGWEGDICDTECGADYYGMGCNATCSINCHADNSSSRLCDRVSGHCIAGCDPGWDGDLCASECESGFYGPGCNSTCTINCDKGSSNNQWCDHVGGVCLEGCVPGWTGEFCESECVTGRFGKGCNATCSTNCNPVNRSSRVCHRENGSCLGGCMPGWDGHLCNTECPDGTYGFNCSEECGVCASDTVCDKSNGTCHFGCSKSYAGDDCLKLVGVVPDSGSSVPVGGVVGGVVAAAVVIGVVLVALFFLRRRRRGRERKSHIGLHEIPDSDQTTSKPSEDIHNHNNGIHGNSLGTANPTYEPAINDKLQNEENEMKASDDTYYNEPENLYYNSPGDAKIPKSGIYLSDLKGYVLNHCTSGRLEDEFKSVPYGLQYPTKNALKPANKGKNRYKDMYPYDHSRVRLDTLPGQSDTDYINACYVDGYKKEKAFIAAQGPTETNVADFWRMIWEKNVNTIVMVTNPTEKGKMKCIRYWTKETDTEENNAFEVSVTSEELFHVMVVRTIKFKLASQADSRIVTQYHFTAWPDKSTPDGATGLVQFLLKCRQNYADKNAPVVVHCSAGVGRTGTYIGLDILYQQGKELGYVDVLGVFKGLREQRVNMVQTKGQYVFLHEAAHEAVVLPSPVPMCDFLDVYTEMLETSQLREEFQSIEGVLLSQKVRNKVNEIKEDEDDFLVATYADNKSRNRYDDILVANEFRQFLSTQVEGCSNYINAVFVQSHRDSRGFLLSQAPLSHTAVDCCRLIDECSISCVVVFDYDKLEEDEKYLPEEGSITIGPFEAKVVSSEQKGGYSMNTHQIVHKGKAHDVRQLVYNDWSGHSTVPSPDGLVSFLKLVEDVETIQRTTDGPILVHCQNGADKSGLFAVLLHVMERMRMDGDVAIPQTIRMARRRRQQIIPNYDQYKFCHDAVQYHLEDSSTYANL